MADGLHAAAPRHVIGRIAQCGEKFCANVIRFTRQRPVQRYPGRPIGSRCTRWTSGVRAMQRSIPLQWIEQSEATKVLSSALFEQATPPSVGESVGAALADWLNRVHSWLIPQLPSSWPVLQAQPVLIRRSQGLRMRQESDSGEYRCHW